MRIKWGIGRAISESKKLPIVIPIYHLGMDSILPNKYPYIPHFGQKVTVIVGTPIKLEETLQDLKNSNASPLEMRLKITELIQKQLFSLRTTAEIYHAKHLSGGWK